ncbi:MAG: ScpA family protein [Pseudomonadota bacterium]
MSTQTPQATGGTAKKSPNTPMDRVWQDNGPERRTGESAFVVDLQGFEGPMDLLLHLARNQKVDLTQISVLELARQYLAFVEHAKSVRMELAADYLVMAAWLAFLKSKLLIPQPKNDDEPSGEEMAAILQFRLQRLEAMRDAAAKLVNRHRLGRDVFARGAPETVIVEKRSLFEANLYDLLGAYAEARQRDTHEEVVIQQRKVWSLKDARSALRRMVGDIGDWAALDTFLVDAVGDASERTSALASAFAVSLEMVREGEIDLKQDKAFAPLMLRRRPSMAKDDIQGDVQ